MDRTARARFCTGLPWIMMVSLAALAGCDSAKPPPPPAPKPAAVAPPAPAAKPAPAPVAQPAQPSEKQKADADLAGRVKAALSADPGIQGFAIDVTADDGVVTLFGTARTKSRRDKAGQVASRVSGVKTVSNKLAIVAGS